MCGILFVVGDGAVARHSVAEVQALSSLMVHRGPDERGAATLGTRAVMAHERLSIVDLSASGTQPLRLGGDGGDPAAATLLVANGEIYNHAEVRRALGSPHPTSSTSDCEVLLHAHAADKARGAPPGDFVAQLRGMFAFVLYDGRSGTALAARDHLGIKPLYMGFSPGGSPGGSPGELTWFSSELKPLVGVCSRVREFPPGHVWSSDAGLRPYYDVHAALGSVKPAAAAAAAPSLHPPPPPPRPTREEVWARFEHAVRRRLMADVPVGAFLSGGLDSSVVCAVMRKLMGPGARARSSTRDLLLLSCRSSTDSLTH